MAQARAVRFLLDTNVISEIRKRERADANVARWILQTPAEEMGTSVVVLAEIRRGIELKRRTDLRQAKSLDRWYAGMREKLGDRVLPVDEAVAEAWAVLGIPDALPLIDGLLAATAKVHGLTLVTRDIRDIARTGVSVLDPFAVLPSVT
jgi:toxin FitB